MPVIFLDTEESREQGRLSGDQRRNPGLEVTFGLLSQIFRVTVLKERRVLLERGTQRRSAFTRGEEKRAREGTDRELGARRAYGVS